MGGYAPGRQNVMLSASTQPQNRAPSPTASLYSSPQHHSHLPITTQSEALSLTHSWPAFLTRHQTEALLSHLSSPPPHSTTSIFSFPPTQSNPWGPLPPGNFLLLLPSLYTRLYLYIQKAEEGEVKSLEPAWAIQ